METIYVKFKHKNQHSKVKKYSNISQKDLKRFLDSKYELEFWEFISKDEYDFCNTFGIINTSDVIKGIIVIFFIIMLAII
jgi:hypothetical protein